MYHYRVYLLLRRDMRIFKNILFHKWAKKIGLDNKTLEIIINEISTGLYDGKLGGLLYKKRIGIKGKGKRSSLRTIIAFRKEDKAFFMYGYSKNVRVNIDEKEKQMYLKLAKIYFSYNKKQIAEAIKMKKFIEVL